MQYTFNVHYNTNPGTGFEVEETYFLATNPPMIERVIIDNQTGLTLAGSYVDAQTGVHVLDSEVEARIEAFNAEYAEVEAPPLPVLVQYVYWTAQALLTGLRDPKVIENLEAEGQEFGEAVASGDVIEMALEAADVLYYAAKWHLNEPGHDQALIWSEIDRLAAAFAQVGLTFNPIQLVELVTIKYDLRKNGKDKAREYAAMAAHLGIAVEWTIRAVRVFDDENGFLQEETVSRTFHTASDALAGLWSMKDSVSYSDIKVTVQVRGSAGSNAI